MEHPVDKSHELRKASRDFDPISFVLRAKTCET